MRLKHLGGQKLRHWVDLGAVVKIELTDDPAALAVLFRGKRVHGAPRGRPGTISGEDR